MAANPQRFADLLTEAIYAVRAHEAKPIRVIEDELGYALGRRGRAVIEHYRKGNLPPNYSDITTLAQELQRRGHLPPEWLRHFYQAAAYPLPDPNTPIPTAPTASAPTAPTPPPPVPATHTLHLPQSRLPNPSPLPLGSIMPLSRNPHFVGREQDLLTLARALARGQTAAVSQVETAAATGLGGIGKTQLATEFVHRYGQFFPGGVFWLSFDRAQAIPAQIAASGGPGALELRPDFGLYQLEEQVRLVQSAWQQPDARLLIFDNCEDPHLLTQWRPASGGCRILVTSRRGDWDSVLSVQMLPLGVLTRAESIALLQRYCPPDTTLDAIAILDAIAEELGDLPLALHLAGSYLDRYQLALTPSAYLAQLRDPALLQHPSLQGHTISPTGHVQHVGRTFALSYDRLDLADVRDRLAQRLLVCMAHFAPGEPIWYDLLVKMSAPTPAEEDSHNLTHLLAVADAFARLVELGLVEKTAGTPPSEEQTTGENTASQNATGLRMHRLVAAFVRQVAAADMAESQRAVEQVVFDAMLHVNRTGYPMPLLARQVHLRAVVDLAHTRDDLPSADLCTELGHYLWQIRDYAEARLYLQKALTIRLTLLGQNHLATAESYHHLGNVLRDTGELEQAKQYYEQALAVRQQYLGTDDLQVAETLNNFGWLLRLERKAEPTRQYLTRALTIAQSKLPPNHRTIADYANNLGLCLQDCIGDLTGAHQYFHMALQIRQAALPADHPLLANSLNNMGYVLHALGELVAARSYYEQTLALRRKLWGNYNPEIAVSLKNLGTVVQAQGHLAEARTILEECLAVYIRTLGETNTRTSFGLDSLGLLLLEQGELPGAHAYLARALAVRRQTYPAHHPNLAISLEHLSRVLVAQGHNAAAHTHLQEALTIRRHALGATHPLTQQTATRLATLPPPP